MVSKSKAGQKKSRVDVGKLRLNKETVKSLTPVEKRNVKGGATNDGTGCTRGASGCSGRI